MTRRKLLLGFGGITLLAQSRQERGKKVVNAALEALGGSQYMSMKDRTESGRAYSFYNDRLTGLQHARIYTRYLTPIGPPSADFFGVRERQSFGKDKEISAVLFTETDAWAINFRGARPIGEDIEARFRDSTRRNIFYILRQRLGEPGMVIEHEGADISENAPVEIVSITDTDNRVVKVFFHATTKLPVRQEYSRLDEKTKIRNDEVSRFSKYRDVTGVQWPFQIGRERNGDKLFEIFSESVTINKGLTDEQFTLPTTMKVLPKERD